MRLTKRIVIALVPLASTPVVGWLLADGYLNLGGGEKDVVWVLPLMLWSVLFAIAFIMTTRRRNTVRSALLPALAWATGLVIGLSLLLVGLASDWLGFR